VNAPTDAALAELLHAAAHDCTHEDRQSCPEWNDIQARVAERSEVLAAALEPLTAAAEQRGWARGLTAAAEFGSRRGDTRVVWSAITRWLQHVAAHPEWLAKRGIDVGGLS